MKRILDIVRGKLHSNTWMKIGALLFAIFIWCYVITETNPVREKDIKNVPVSIVGYDELESNGITVKGSIEDILKSVSVTIQTEQNYLSSISANSINAVVDLSKITSVGTVTLDVKVSVDASLASVVSVNPSKVEVTVEEYVRKIIPVEATVIDSPPEGYYIGEIATDPVQIEIAGASSDVKGITKALCYLSVKNTTKSINESCDLSIMDENGEAIDARVLKEYVRSAIVTAPVYKTKKVPIDITGVVLDEHKVASGYEVTDISFSPESITIAAPDNILDTISTIQIESFSIEGASKDVVMNVLVKPIDGVLYTSDREVTVTVKVREKNITKTFKNIPINAVNVGSGVKSRLSRSTTNVAVTGPKSVIDDLRSDDIVLTVDASGLKAGNYTLKVQSKKIDQITKIAPDISEVNLVLE